MARRNKNFNNNKYRKVIQGFAVGTFVILLALLSFILVSGFNASPDLSLARTYALQTQRALNATPTATPFQPNGSPTNGEPTQQNPILTPQPGTTEAVRTPTPGQTQTPEPTNTPTQTLKKPEGQVNILLLGSDIRPDDGGFRTDSIIWVSLNPKGEFVSAISFPRDLYVLIPGLGYNRINVAFQNGGFDMLAATFEANFGVRPDYYALIDFNGFKTIINNLGGIDVYAEKQLTDSCEKWMNESGTCSVGPGLIHMDGETALWYARSRYSSSDIDRARRAQEVIKAIFNRLMSLDAVLRAPELYNAYTNYVQTDVTLKTVTSMLPLASKIKSNGDIRNYVIGYDHAYAWMTPNGAQVLVPDTDAIRDVMIEALQMFRGN
jgi:LCP family protein required for cell wall assembly